MVFALWFLANNSIAQTHLRTIEVSYVDPSHLIQVIRPILSADSSINVFQRTLVLNVTDSEYQEVQQLVKKLDIAGKQLLISVKSSNQINRQQSDQGIWVDQGKAEISVNKDGYDASIRGRAKLKDKHYSLNSSKNGSHQVRATEGLPTFIATGARRDQVILTRSGTVINHRDSLSGFYATARIIGNEARVIIDQSNESMTHYGTDTQQLKTEISGNLGEWILVGTITDTTSGKQKGILNQSYHESNDDNRIFIKVEVIK